MKSLALQNMVNAKFWGKKVLKPKGKALAKDKVEKARAVNQMD